MIGEATATVRVMDRPAADYSAITSAASTSTSPYQTALDRLLTLRNENGYTFQASVHAHAHAEFYLEATTAILCRTFPVPEFIPDGEGGIDIEWSNGARQVTLSCRATNAQNDYIYWEENGRYDARDFSLGLLIGRLDWLNHA